GPDGGGGGGKGGGRGARHNYKKKDKKDDPGSVRGSSGARQWRCGARAGRMSWAGGERCRDLWARRHRAEIVAVFSSRRRHTRFKCDWSSDVCSSDLDGPPSRGLPLPCRVFPRRSDVRARSEERRVGKECRSRWSPSQYKKSVTR